MGTTGGQRSRLTASPHAQERWLLRRSAPSRRQILIFAREPNSFDATTTWDFLRLLERRSAKSRRRVIAIIDNAKYHHAKLHRTWRQEHEPQFCLDYLPPYSPDLNPIERVWKLTRKLCIHDEYFPNIGAVISAVETQFDKWTNGNETLRRLCSI